MIELRTDFEKAEYFQNLLTAFSTGGGGDDKEYKELRRLFLNNATTEKLIPGWIRTVRLRATPWLTSPGCAEVGYFVIFAA